MTTTGPLVVNDDDQKVEVMQHVSSSSSSYEKKDADDPEALAKFPTPEGNKTSNFYARFRPYILGGIAAAILGWWISATVLPATRHRWYVFTILFFLVFLIMIGLFKHCGHGHSLCEACLSFILIALKRS